MTRIFKLLALLVVVGSCCSICTFTGDLPFQNTTSPTLVQSPQNPLLITPGISPTEEQASITPVVIPSDAVLFPSVLSSQTYDVTQTVYLINDGPGTASHIVFTVALISTFLPYQTVNSMQITPVDFLSETDQYGNHFARYEFFNLAGGDQIEIHISYEITVNALSYSLDNCQGQNISELTSPERYLESDSYEIMSLAQQISIGSNNPSEQSHSFYDYVGNEFKAWVYHADDMGALYAAQNLTGDCTEFSDLFIALNRAAGIPAQFLEGVVCCTENGYDPSENKHDWAKVYLPGIGWVPVDPTFGRDPSSRNQYFASLPADHIIITQGRNLDQLMGYHYYAYQFWWNGESTNVSNEEEWSILKK
jgi:transglutaminase-like putative cysteine protease